MIRTLALAPTLWKGVAVTVAAVVLFVGSVYVLLGAVFGLRMGYLVLAVSFFGWMILFSTLWTFGQPKILGVTGTLPYLGPRGTEPHWQVFAAASGTDSARSSRFPEISRYPESPWHPPDAVSAPSVDTAMTAIQDYLAERATEETARQGRPFEFTPTQFTVEDFHFATGGDGTHLVGAHGYYSNGGPLITVFAYHAKGNVPAYSVAFLGASIFGFLVHLPFLDRAERKRKEILTGGTAPPWYGPA